MSTQQQDTFKPLYFPIWTYRSRSRILHVSDALHLGDDPEEPENRDPATGGKIHLHAFEYQRGRGAIQDAEAFIDAHTFRLLCYDALFRGVVPDNEVKQLGGRKFPDGRVLSRVVTVDIAQGDDIRNPYRIRIENGPGEVANGGLYKPLFWSKDTDATDDVTVMLPWTKARQMAAAVLEHMQARAGATYTARVMAVRWVPEMQEAAGPEEIPQDDPIDLGEARARRRNSAPAAATQQVEDNPAWPGPDDEGNEDAEGAQRRSQGEQMDDFQRADIIDLYGAIFNIDSEKRRLQLLNSACQDRVGKPFDDLTRTEAHNLLTKLRDKQEKDKVKAAAITAGSTDPNTPPWES